MCVVRNIHKAHMGLRNSLFLDVIVFNNSRSNDILDIYSKKPKRFWAAMCIGVPPTNNTPSIWQWARSIRETGGERANCEEEVTTEISPSNLFIHSRCQIRNSFSSIVAELDFLCGKSNDAYVGKNDLLPPQETWDSSSMRASQSILQAA